ncbi:hypothetical protein IG631_04584 [Alternaria alternata]|nr:hypothetical protein IG631_04584 [Alternaria alternata]
MYLSTDATFHRLNVVTAEATEKCPCATACDPKPRYQLYALGFFMNTCHYVR